MTRLAFALLSGLLLAACEDPRQTPFAGAALGGAAGAALSDDEAKGAVLGAAAGLAAGAVASAAQQNMCIYRYPDGREVRARCPDRR